MRWNTMPPKGEQPWVKWFAWYPVMMGGTREGVFLEYVERKAVYPFTDSKSGMNYMYRDIRGS